MSQRIPGYRSHDEKAALSVAAKESKKLVDETNKSGHLHYIAINLATAASLRLKVTIDGQVIFNRSPDEISQAAAAKLGLGNTAGAGGMLQSPAYAANAYNIILDWSRAPLKYGKSLLIEVVNSHASTAYDIDDDFILYDVD